MFNLLDTPLIRVVTATGGTTKFTLPGVMAALMRDEIATFPGLRAHQRHAWHAFLCQVAALAMVQSARAAPWEDEASWRDGLRALTPTHSDDAPWSLVMPADQPALLQPPVPSGLTELDKVRLTPDALDMLVTSRNHDLKGEVMVMAAPEDWLFALVTLQTMQGQDGAGNYGISRMNKGYGNRPALGVAPRGGPGAHVRRDIARLLELRETMRNTSAYAMTGGHALLWLQPWDGTTSIRPEMLDPFYVEICRRARLTEANGRIVARAGGSELARVAATGGGLTGDPWAPLVADKEGRKVFTIKGDGFHYRRMVKLMWPGPGDAAPLQIAAKTDATEGLVLVARALARGQGKTEGYHERRILLSRQVVRMAMSSPTDPVAQAAQRRVELAGKVARVLRTALLTLFQGGPDRVDEHDKKAPRKAQPFLDRFDAAVDQDFFDDLWREAEAPDEDAAYAERVRWVRALLDQAHAILDEADHAAPKATRRRLRARVRAQGVLHRLPHDNEALRPYVVQDAADAA